LGQHRAFEPPLKKDTRDRAPVQVISRIEVACHMIRSLQPGTNLTEEALQSEMLQMSFWSGFSFMSRRRVIQKDQRECQDLSIRSEAIPEYDHHQLSMDREWSFNEYGGTSYLDHLERGTDTYCQSDDGSRHLSLTTASLKRLVKNKDAETAVTPAKHHRSSFSLTAVSSPCKSDFPALSGPAFSTHCTLPFDSCIAAHHSL
jgi:hypothetical protein